MLTGIHVCNEIDEHIWRRFVETGPDGNVFHTPEMYQVFARARRHRPSLWAATDASGSPLALFLPVEITVVNPMLRPWTCRAVAYGGLLCADGAAGRRAMGSLLATYSDTAPRRSLVTELRHLSDAADLRQALGDTRFSHEEHLNYLIRLDRPPADLWLGLSKTARQRVRSAKKKGVVVAEVTDMTGGDEAYRLLEQVYHRARVPLADPSLFRGALCLLYPRGMLRIFTARLGEKVIGARFLLTYRGRILDWYAGSDRAFASFSPNELLVWHALRWGQEHGFRVFDFGGAGRPGEHYGPREFKAKFGGDLVNFGRDVLIHAPLRFRMSRLGYAAARGLLWGGAPAGKRAPA